MKPCIFRRICKEKNYLKIYMFTVRCMFPQKQIKNQNQHCSKPAAIMNLYLLNQVLINVDLVFGCIGFV